KYFSFVKTVEIDGEKYDVDVDILAGLYGGTTSKRRSQHVQGIKALKEKRRTIYENNNIKEWQCWIRIR
ncbi:MAG: hypothetical protein K6G75_07700, partial [Lachnospiraceae bacterium]|nr:hypothetical protein [Lachnospiraceae bacterium]